MCAWTHTHTHVPISRLTPKSFSRVLWRHLAVATLTVPCCCGTLTSPALSGCLQPIKAITSLIFCCLKHRHRFRSQSNFKLTWCLSCLQVVVLLGSHWFSNDPSIEMELAVSSREGKGFVTSAQDVAWFQGITSCRQCDYFIHLRAFL